MITTAKEYYENLLLIQDQNPPSLAVLLPSDEKIYQVDLNSRSVEAPAFLGVSEDHRSEIIYFVTDRYFEYKDLAETVCLIYYVNANKEQFFYPVPFYDVTTCSTVDEETGVVKNKLLFPWLIDAVAMKKAGIIEFAINFYQIDPDTKEILYNLSTLPAKSKVLNGLSNIHSDNWNQDFFNPNAVLSQDLIARITTLENVWYNGVKWLSTDEI